MIRKKVSVINTIDRQLQNAITCHKLILLRKQKGNNYFIITGGISLTVLNIYVARMLHVQVLVL